VPLVDVVLPIKGNCCLLLLRHLVQDINESAAKVVADKGATAWTSSMMQSVAALQHSSSCDSSRVGLPPEPAGPGAARLRRAAGAVGSRRER
jgi:hypothetical protein